MPPRMPADSYSDLTKAATDWGSVSSLFNGEGTLLKTGFHWSSSAQAQDPQCELLPIILSTYLCEPRSDLGSLSLYPVRA